MDWGRAKTILIAAFLLLNAVLGYQLWTSKSTEIMQNADTTGMLEETKRLLRQHNIQFPEDLPKEAPKLRGLTVKYDPAMNTGKRVALQNHFQLNTLFNKSQFRDLLSRPEIRRLEDYQYDPSVSKNGVYVFNQMVKDLPMFDVRLELYEEKGEIVAYRQAHAELDDSANSDQKEQSVLPAAVALRSLVDNYQLDNTSILNIRLGYHGQMFNTQPQYLVPTWRVMFSNGDVYYIHGFNGAVEAPQADDGTPAVGGAGSSGSTAVGQ